MNTILTSPSAIIDALGGTSKVAALTGRTLQAVSNWRASRNLPPDTYLILTNALFEHGYKAPPAVWRMPEAHSTAEAL